MLHRVVGAVCFLLLSCSPFRALADAPTCAVRVEGDPTGPVSNYWDIPRGPLLLSAHNGLFRYEGMRTNHVEGDETGGAKKFYELRGELLLSAEKGLFRYDGKRTNRVEGGETGGIDDFFDVKDGLLLSAEKGLFKYDGKRTNRVDGDKTGAINKFHDLKGGVLLVGAEKGLFKYDGKRTNRVEGDETGITYEFHDLKGGVLLYAENGLFKYDGKRTNRVEGDETGVINEFHDLKGGVLLVGAEKGLFRYDGKRITLVKAADSITPENKNDESDVFSTGEIHHFYESGGELLLGAEKGLFKYDGKSLQQIFTEEEEQEDVDISEFYNTRGVLLLGTSNGLYKYDSTSLIKVEGDETGKILQFHETPRGLLLGAEKGLFLYNGSGATTQVDGDETGSIKEFHDTPVGQLLVTDRGLFFYDGGHVALVLTEKASIQNFHDTPSGLLLNSSGGGLFRVLSQPLSTAAPSLENVSQLRDATTGEHVVTKWNMIHPCSSALLSTNADVLEIVATRVTDAKTTTGSRTPETVSRSQATGFRSHGDTLSFEAKMPVPEPGNWTFRVVSTIGGSETNIGQPSEAIPFVAPGSSAWWAIWGKFIAGIFTGLVAALNLLVFAAARYSRGAWRLATDEIWGKKALFLQSLMLRHWRGAQLWLLDLYVQERRAAVIGKTLPYLPLPLTGPDGEIADSDAVLARFAVARRLWVQGGTGMGKTAMFLHLRHIHFGGAEHTSFAIFRRHGYVLVPIEARRFPEAPFEERGASAWVLACILSVLSEGGLSFEDRGLLRAMLSKGTLAIEIDGLNEVGRGQAVSAFAAEFPATPVFVTSQEPGESPFEIWRLPRTIAEHINGLLTLYLGERQGAALANRLREIGLMQHLLSGYDVRLVIDLAKNDPEGTKLPRHRIELYREAVAAAWPEGDDRLELLQAAAWKLMSERGPNEDKRRLKPDQDAPKDLLEQLEGVRERWGRSIRLIRLAQPGYEFVHDQMNAYLAACWFADRLSVAIMKDLLEATKIWQDGLEAQRTLWGFVAAILDRPQVESLWIFAGDDDRRAVLGRALVERAESESWTLMRPPIKAPAVAAEGETQGNRLS